MKIILLSGGSGRRLWPLSNDSRSKQFLKVLDRGDGELESMLQRVWRQLKSVKLQDSTFIATSGTQVDMIQSQLGCQIPIIIEPERRDTFPAVALACSYLYSIQNIAPHEVICVLPVDPYVDESFFHKVKELESILLSTGSELALMGSDPTFPSEKYGYIVPSSHHASSDYFKVSRFVEKPPEEIAIALIQQKAFWNCGVFAFRLQYLISFLERNGWSSNYEELRKKYSQLPKRSFDFEVVEKAQDLVAVPYEGEWKDLGTWITLTEEMETPLIGKGLISSDSRNTHVINELDIPLAVLGLNNIVVACSPDGILVSSKSSSPKLKEVLKHHVQRPMYEERRWGWYRVLDYCELEPGRKALTKKIMIYAGNNLSYQLHKKREEVWTILSGTGTFAFNGKFYPVKPGDVLSIPMGAKHAIRATTDMTIIEVQTGIELIEEDINRIFMTWEEIEKELRH